MGSVDDQNITDRNNRRSIRKPRAARVRSHHAWTFTLHNPNVHIKLGRTKAPPRLLEPPHKFLYMIFGIEVGGINGTVHYQGFVYFSSRKTWKEMRTMFPCYHVEPAVKLIMPNVEYCQKECNYHEYGCLADALVHQDLLFLKKFPKEHSNGLLHASFMKANKL